MNLRSFSSNSTKNGIDSDEMCKLIRPALVKLGYRNHTKKNFLDKLVGHIKNTARKCQFELRDVKMIEGLARRVADVANRYEVTKF